MEREKEKRCSTSPFAFSKFMYSVFMSMDIAHAVFSLSLECFLAACRTQLKADSVCEHCILTYRHKIYCLCTESDEQRNTFERVFFLSQIRHSVWNASFIYHSGFFFFRLLLPAIRSQCSTLHVGLQDHLHIFYLNSRNCRDVVQIQN